MSYTLPFDVIDSKNVLSAFDSLVYTLAQKQSHGSEIVRQVMDSLSDSSFIEAHRLDREHMNLHQGRWEQLKDFSAYREVVLESGEKITFGRENVNFYSYINIVSHQAAEKIISALPKTVIKDMGKYARIFKSEKEKEIIKSEISRIYIQPIINEKTMEYDRQHGYSDITMVPPEAQKQRQEDLNRINSEAISNRVKDMLDDIVTPTEDLYYYIMRIVEKRSAIAEAFETACHYVVATGKLAFIPRFGLNEVTWDTCNVANLEYRLSNRSKFIEDGIWAKYTEKLTPVEIIGLHYDIFEGKDFKQIDKMLTPLSNDGYNHNKTNADISYRYTNANLSGMPDEYLEYDKGYFDEATNTYVRGKAGMNSEVIDPNLVKYISDAYANRNLGMSLNHYFWKWTAWGYRVERGFGKDKEVFFASEHYEKGMDEKVTKVILPQSWQGEEVGGFYFNMKATPYQYPNPDNLKDNKLGIYGAEIGNIFHNEVKNTSLIGPAKAYQLQFNILNDVMVDVIKDDMGPVLMINEEAISSTYGHKGFFDMLYKLKTIVYKKGTGSNNDSSSAIRMLDMARSYQIDQIKSAIQYTKEMVQTSMRFNPQQVGGANPYAGEANIQNSMDIVDRGLNHHYSMTAQVKNRVMEASVRMNIREYRNNKYIKENYLPETLALHLENNLEEIIGSPMSFETPNDMDSRNNATSFKRLLIQYMATDGDIDIAGDIMDEKEMYELKKIAKRVKKEKGLQAEKAHQNRMDEINATNEGLKSVSEDKYKMHLEDIKQKRESSYLNSLMLQNAGDINQNKQADFIENADKDRELKEKIELLKLDLKKYELDLQRNKSK